MPSSRPGSSSGSRPGSSSGAAPARPSSRAGSSAGSDASSFEYTGRTEVDTLAAPFNSYLKSSAIKAKLKKAGTLVDKAKKRIAKGENIKVKSGFIKGRVHESKKTSDGNVVSIRLFDQAGEALDTGMCYKSLLCHCQSYLTANFSHLVHVTQDGSVTYQKAKADQKDGRDGRL